MRFLKNSSYLANMDRAYSFLIFKADDKSLLFEIVFIIVWIGGGVIAING